MKHKQKSFCTSINLLLLILSINIFFSFYKTLLLFCYLILSLCSKFSLTLSLRLHMTNSLKLMVICLLNSSSWFLWYCYEYWQEQIFTEFSSDAYHKNKSKKTLINNGADVFILEPACLLTRSSNAQLGDMYLCTCTDNK